MGHKDHKEMWVQLDRKGAWDLKARVLVKLDPLENQYIGVAFGTPLYPIVVILSYLEELIPL
tara:strand:+ start:29 stop:214 length:186 start_codon:yes stop_codon:yes gene_type:complete